jgi:hypothetical protein
MSEIYSCDKITRNGRCRRKPYMEVFWKSDTCGENKQPCPFGCTRHWSYLCRWHYYLDRIKNFIFRGDNWYAEASEVEMVDDEDD